jgi:uncharacterized protein (TIGR00297 family)
MKRRFDGEKATLPAAEAGTVRWGVSASRLEWQSKAVLLLVVPFVAADTLLQSEFWIAQNSWVAFWTLGLSALLGLITWRLRAATPGAAATGATITASLMYSTLVMPYQPWHTAMVPMLAVSLLAFAATRVGRARKEQLGTAEGRRGRSAAQIAANLGIAALAVCDAVQTAFSNSPALTRIPDAVLVASLAALAEAAADTVSSEVGQVFGGRPRMITTLGSVDPGTDGAISLAGTLAGVAAAAVIAGLGAYALRGNGTLFATSCAGGIFGLFFDSLLGATLERRGWLNNDAVNFLSTASAAVFAIGLQAALR